MQDFLAAALAGVARTHPGIAFAAIERAFDDYHPACVVTTSGERPAANLAPGRGLVADEETRAIDLREEKADDPVMVEISRYPDGRRIARIPAHDIEITLPG